MKLHITFILGFLVFLSSPLHSKSDIRIDDRLPAGNIVFEKFINDTVYIHQDMRGADKVWFYECFPYTPQMWSAFMKSSDKNLYEKGVLCKSLKGRKVPFYRIPTDGASPKLSVVVTSRHHCSEAPATFVVEGLV